MLPEKQPREKVPMPLRPERAWELIEVELEPLGAEHVPRARACGRVLAESLAARVDMPPADVSAMDGYALAGETAVGVALEVAGLSAAGAPPAFSVPPGAAARIMTGAVLPAGADRVIPVEQTNGGHERVVITELPEAGVHVRRRGEIVPVGAPLFARRARLTPGAVSLLASHGIAEVPVVRMPRVAVLTTGDEVVPPEVEPGPGQLRDSNTAFLLAAGRTLGLDFQALGIAPDRVEELRAKIAQGLESDVLVLGGGVSMGEFDLVEDVLAELGCRKLFDQVAIQPGKPLVAARHDGGWVFGLPGNPASVMVTFWLFVRPVLRRLMGSADGFWHGALAATLETPLPASKGRDLFLPTELRAEGGQLFASATVPKGSHDVVAYARGTALTRVRIGQGPWGVGERCEVLEIGGG